METQVQVQNKNIKVNGVQLHYREWENTGAPPVIILHGLTGHAWEFDRVASVLADRYHVFSVNQRGHGASSWAEDYSPTVMADDIAAFIDALNLKQARIIGHSMGGVNGWWLAARYPEKVERFVLLDVEPQAITSVEVVDLWKNILDSYCQAQFASADEAVAEYLDGYTGTNRQELQMFVINNLRETPDGRRTWRFDACTLFRWMENSSADLSDHWSMIRKINCPVLLVKAGKNDYTSLPEMERMAREIRDSRLVQIHDSGHDIHIEQFEKLMEEINIFLLGG